MHKNTFLEKKHNINFVLLKFRTKTKNFFSQLSFKKQIFLILIIFDRFRIFVGYGGIWNRFKLQKILKFFLWGKIFFLPSYKGRKTLETKLSTNKNKDSKDKIKVNPSCQLQMDWNQLVFFIAPVFILQEVFRICLKVY